MIRETDVEQLGGKAIDLGAGATSTGTQRVVLASDSPVAPSGTATVTSVSALIADTLVLAANTSRLWAYIVNDSASATSYVKLGSGASATSMTFKMLPGEERQIPYQYKGAVYAYWSAAVGAMRVTEIA